MSDDVYRRLAHRLDTIPNGFSPTESGVELRLLARIFTPEEAALAAVMRLRFESPVDIAARADVEPATAYRTLKAMARRRLIHARRGDSHLTFALMPFIVGIYEEQLPHLDAEMAALFEQYFQETQGGSPVHHAPPIHRVIPVEEAIPFDLEIFPYERASELLAGAKAWGVRDCICRVQQHLVGRGCERPVENCLVFAPIEGAFDGDEVTRAIGKDEAFRILHEAEEAGLVHSTGNYRDEHFYICNCCTCCCGVLRSVAEFNIPTALAHSNFRAVVDAELCAACEDCVERCQFGALSVLDGVAVVDHVRCVGCGLCASACSTGALRLERCPADEFAPLPDDIDQWMARRARARGISLSDIS